MIPCGGTGDVAADRHAFQQRVRIALHLVAVHVGARIALIGVADQVLPVPDGLSEIFEFQAGREARAAAAAQPGQLELFVHCLRRAVAQHLVQRLVAADRDVLLDVVGVDQAAVAQHDLLLALEERHLVPGRHRRESAAIVDLRVTWSHCSILHSTRLSGTFRPVSASRIWPTWSVRTRWSMSSGWPGQPDIDQRLLGAKPEASGLRKLHVEAALADGISESVVDALRSVAGPAGAHADGDARPRGQKLCHAGFANRVRKCCHPECVSRFGLPLLQGFQFTLQCVFVHVTEDRSVAGQFRPLAP